MKCYLCTVFELCLLGTVDLTVLYVLSAVYTRIPLLVNKV